MPPSTSHSSSMPPASWRALTTSRLASFRDYIAQKDYRASYDVLSSMVRGKNQNRQSWDQWARSSTHLQRMSLGTERVQLFPGWAVRRYLEPEKADQKGAEFSLDVYISGFASSVRPPDAATRSQRAFYRIAKGYAALPKLPTVTTPDDGSLQTSVTQSDVDLSTLPPTPVGGNDESDLAALEAHLNPGSHLSSSRSSDGDSERDETPNGDKINSYGFLSSPPTHASASSDQPGPSFPEQLINNSAHKLHANLDARLQPFWSSAVPNRLVRLSIYCPFTGYAPEAQEDMDEQVTHEEPVFTQNVITNRQGSFQVTLTVPWERLATHPPTLHVAFGEPYVEHPVIIQAEMWPPPLPPAPSGPILDSPYLRGSSSHSQSYIPSGSSIGSSSSSHQGQVRDSQLPSMKCRVTVLLSVPHVPVRLISDIDDTIKHAGVHLGAKHVFRNVFVRHHDELVVHSMVEWYKRLWQRGVRFHYVSNSPFELLPVLNEFFSVSSLPHGSIKLKSYGARSLLPALLSSPASRKRQGVVDVLDAFQESRFILVGDSGEQDMELYAELARERPDQILGVFIREVTTDATQAPLYQQAQVVGGDALNGRFGAPVVDREPEPVLMPSPESLTSISFSRGAPTNDGLLPHLSPAETLASPPGPSSSTPTTPTTGRFPSMLQRRKSSGSTSSKERKRYELTARIERVRGEIPQHIAFKVFQEPDECLEVETLLRMWSGNMS